MGRSGFIVRGAERIHRRGANPSLARRGPSPPPAFLLVPRNGRRPLPQLRGRGGRGRDSAREAERGHGRSAPLPDPPPQTASNCVGEGDGTGQRRHDAGFSPSPVQDRHSMGADRLCTGEGAGGVRVPPGDGGPEPLQLREGCAPAGPRTRSGRHSSIVPAAQGARRRWAQLYRALRRAQPDPSAAEGHARNGSTKVRE
jgi:hypothetical protein